MARSSWQLGDESDARRLLDRASVQWFACAARYLETDAGPMSRQAMHAGIWDAVRAGQAPELIRKRAGDLAEEVMRAAADSSPGDLPVEAFLAELIAPPSRRPRRGRPG
jgi:hypothetical protein